MSRQHSISEYLDRYSGFVRVIYCTICGKEDLELTEFECIEQPADCGQQPVDKTKNDS